MEKDFTPLEILNRALRGWWLVALCVLLGAAVGWLFHRTQPPIYRARASLSSVIDLNRTGVLTDVQEDRLISIAEDIMSAPETYAAVSNAARDQGVEIQKDEFLAIASIEQSYSEWNLDVLNQDPKTAALLANIWREVSYNSLFEAYGHAVKAEGLLRYLDSLESCLEESVAVAPVQTQCIPYNLQSLTAELEVTGKQAKDERQASHGLSTALLISSGNPAQIPDKPVNFGLNILMLGGGLAGFALAVWAVSAGTADWIIRRLRGG